MESDVDSESDGGLTSFDEGINSDTELLIGTSGGGGGGCDEGRVGRLRRWSNSWSPSAVGQRTRNKARGCRLGCGVCVTSCAACTPRKASVFLVNKVRLLVLKLVEVARLFADRRVFLSTSLYGMYGGIHVLISEVKNFTSDRTC